MSLWLDAPGGGSDETDLTAWRHQSRGGPRRLSPRRPDTRPAPPVAADCGCGIPDDCECDCALSYSEVQIPCFYPCDPPYPGCTAPVFEIVQYQCCNYIGIACGGTATVIARVPCPY